MRRYCCWFIFGIPRNLQPLILLRFQANKIKSGTLNESTKKNNYFGLRDFYNPLLLRWWCWCWWITCWVSIWIKLYTKTVINERMNKMQKKYGFIKVKRNFWTLKKMSHAVIITWTKYKIFKYYICTSVWCD